MNIDYELDYILIVALFSTILIVKTIQQRKSLSYNHYVLLPLLIGFLIVLLSTIGNSFLAKNWNGDYLISFLLLKKVSPEWIFRHLCSFGYILLNFGVVLLLIAWGNRRAQNV